MSSPLLPSLQIGGAAMALPVDIVRRIVADQVYTMSKEQALQDVAQAWTVRYGCLAAVTIVLWDWIITFSDEVEFIWLRASGMSGRPLYCFIRYIGTAYQVYDLITQFGVWDNVTYCKAYFGLLPIGTLAFLYAADVLLAYRALCLWRMKRTLVIFNVVVFSFSVIASGLFAGYSIAQYNVVPTPKIFTGCWASIPDYNFIAPIPGLLFEFWIFLLVVFRAFSFSKKEGLKMSKLSVVQMLFKDSMWWFSMITLLLVVNTLFLATAPTNLTTFFIPLFRSFVIIFGCHLVLRMRRAAAGTSRLPSAIEMDTWYQQQQHFRRQKSSKTTTTTSGSDSRPGSRTKFRIKCPYCRKIARLGWWGDSCREHGAGGDSSRKNSNEESAGISTSEVQRIERTLDIAQKMGLPPALHQDLMMWYDPLTTLNQGNTEMEMTEVGGSGQAYVDDGYDEEVEEGKGVDETDPDTTTMTVTSMDERSMKKEIFLRSPRTRFIGIPNTGHQHHPGHQHLKSSSLSAASCWDGTTTSASPSTDHKLGGFDEDDDGRVEFDVRYTVGEDDDDDEQDVGLRRAGSGSGRWVDVEHTTARSPKRGPGMV